MLVRKEYCRCGWASFLCGPDLVSETIQIRYKPDRMHFLLSFSPWTPVSLVPRIYCLSNVRKLSEGPGEVAAAVLVFLKRSPVAWEWLVELGQAPKGQCEGSQGTPNLENPDHCADYTPF